MYANWRLLYAFMVYTNHNQHVHNKFNTKVNDDSIDWIDDQNELDYDRSWGRGGRGWLRNSATG